MHDNITTYKQLHVQQIHLKTDIDQRRTNIFQGVGAEVTIWQSHSPKSP